MMNDSGGCSDGGMGKLGPFGDCGDAVHRLYHFLDGELDDARRADISRHLDDCRPCVEAFDFEKRLRDVIAQKCLDRVPDDLRSRIAVALQHEFKPAENVPPPDGITDL